MKSVMEGPYGIAEVVTDTAHAVAGSVWLSLVLRQTDKQMGWKWGNSMLTGDPITSPYMGQAMSLGHYIVGLIGSNVGARIYGRFFGERAGVQFWRSGFTDLAKRLIYTELFGRSKWAQDNFGNYTDDWVGVYDDGNGNRYLQREGSDYMPAMMGLEVATPAMGDHLVAATPYGGFGRRRGFGDTLVPATPYGHAIIRAGDRLAERHAANIGSGSTNPFHAAYGYQGL